MRSTDILRAAPFALALALAGCSGGEDGATSDEGTEATETDPAGEEAAAPEDMDYFVDESGFMEDDVQAPIEARLAAYRSASGNTAMVVTIMTTEERDIEEVASEMLAERGVDGLILVAGGDQQLAIVGRNIENGGTNEAEQAMIDAFDDDRMPEGFEQGVEYLIQQLGE